MADAVHEDNSEDKGGGPGDESNLPPAPSATDDDDHSGPMDVNNSDANRVGKRKSPISDSRSVKARNEDQGHDDTSVSDNEQDTEVSQPVIVIELLGKSKDEKLIVDKATILHLINSSVFKEKYSGEPRRMFSKHQIVLNITNPDHVSDLLNVEKLTNEEGDWPVKCRRGRNESTGLHIGILKGIHQDVSINRVKANLVRQGLEIGEVTRLQNRYGPTKCIIINFNNEIPSEIMYAGRQTAIHRYNPPDRNLICNKCSLGGHKAEYCNTKGSPRCPMCSGPHSKRDCPRPKVDDKLIFKCPNCPDDAVPHTATYGKCPYLIKEKEIMKIRIRENVPRHIAKTIWSKNEEERKKSAFQNPGNLIVVPQNFSVAGEPGTTNLIRIVPKQIFNLSPGNGQTDNNNDNVYMSKSPLGEPDHLGETGAPRVQTDGRLENINLQSMSRVTKGHSGEFEGFTGQPSGLIVDQNLQSNFQGSDTTSGIDFSQQPRQNSPTFRDILSTPQHKSKKGAGNNVGNSLNKQPVGLPHVPESLLSSSPIISNASQVVSNPITPSSQILQNASQIDLSQQNSSLLPQHSSSQNSFNVPQHASQGFLNTTTIAQVHAVSNTQVPNQLVHDISQIPDNTTESTLQGSKKNSPGDVIAKVFKDNMMQMIAMIIELIDLFNSDKEKLPVIANLCDRFFTMYEQTDRSMSECSQKNEASSFSNNCPSTQQNQVPQNYSAADNSNLRSLRPQMSPSPSFSPQQNYMPQNKQQNTPGNTTTLHEGPQTPVPSQTFFNSYSHGYDLTPSHINRLLKEQQRSGSQSPLDIGKWMSLP